ncbi:MAG: hypothetical protein KC800_17755 [Candidatus Eremiobacteraeota bacterium]|nr:hypothetical protein [Candidatus Eremiobacteraeota bacterium]
MLIEFPCPKCGGPALTQGGEVSCPLCGNQEAPPEALQREAVANGESAPPLAASVEVPNVIEFEIGREVADKEDWSDVCLAFAVEYLLGFVETYGSLPEVEALETGTTLHFSPSSGQAAALAELCSRHATRPEVLMQLAATLYVEREK